MTTRTIRLGLLAGLGVLAFHLGDDLGHMLERTLRDRDELAWFADGFGVHDARLGELRSLHERFIADHQQANEVLEATSAEFTRELDRAGMLTPQLRNRLAELERQRGRQHLEVLEHCLKVRAVLGGETGERYLREMERVLLGLQSRHHLARTTPLPLDEPPNE